MYQFLSLILPYAYGRPSASISIKCLNMYVLWAQRFFKRNALVSLISRVLFSRRVEVVLVVVVINLLAPELFFLILAHPVYKIWIIQEPNMLEL